MRRLQRDLASLRASLRRGLSFDEAPTAPAAPDEAPDLQAPLAAAEPSAAAVGGQKA